MNKNQFRFLALLILLTHFCGCSEKYGTDRNIMLYYVYLLLFLHTNMSEFPYNPLEKSLKPLNSIHRNIVYRNSCVSIGYDRNYEAIYEANYMKWNIYEIMKLIKQTLIHHTSYCGKKFIDLVPKVTHIKNTV